MLHTLALHVLTAATALRLGAATRTALILGLLLSAMRTTLPATGLRCRRGRNRQSGDTRGQE